MSATRLLILQGIIPHYRVPIFDRLGREVELVVAHSDEGARIPATDFTPKFLPDRGPGPFHHQRGALALAGDFDVVIAMFDVRWLSSLALCSSSRRPPFVWWGHGYGSGRAARWLRTRLVERAEALLLYDEAPRAAFVAAGIEPRRIFVAPNTVEVEAPFCVDDPAARRRFLFVGRLQERKRVDLLLEAFARIASDVPAEVGIDIVGEGPPGEALRKQAQSLGIAERVRFHGELTDDAALRELFACAIAYVSPGHVGLGVLHACAYGVATITRPGEGHSPEVASLRDGETGRFVDPTPEALAEVLLHLATDPREAHRLGRAAYEHYTSDRRPDQMVDGFLHAITFAIDEHRSRDRGAGATAP